MVVDYAAARADWLGRALYEHATRNSDTEALLRVLVLERSTDGDWLSVAMRQHRHHESTVILTHQYATPGYVHGLSDDDLGELVARTASRSGRTLTAAASEDLVHRARSIDPLGRPLFAIVAAIDWFDGAQGGSTRDSVLRSIATRRSAQRLQSLPSESLRQKTEALATVATTVGGGSKRTITNAYSQSPGRLLPTPICRHPTTSPQTRWIHSSKVSVQTFWVSYMFSTFWLLAAWRPKPPRHR